MHMDAMASGWMKPILRRVRTPESKVAQSSPSPGLRCSSNQQVARLRFILRSSTESLSIRIMKDWMPNSELGTITLSQTVSYGRFQVVHHRPILKSMPTQDRISASSLRLLLGHRILHELSHQKQLRHESDQGRAQRRSDRPRLINVES